MLHLMSHVLLHPLLQEDLPLRHQVEEGPRGDGDGHGILRFGLFFLQTIKQQLKQLQKVIYFVGKSGASTF